MENISYGHWAAWIAICQLWCVWSVNVFAQPGFLSIQCGGKTNYTDENNITWISDANYIEVGQTADIGKANGSYLHTLRFFPKPLNKSCYQLPVTPHVPHLVILWFAFGNYNGLQQVPTFAFSIETLGMLDMENVRTTNQFPYYVERILVSSGRVLYICLIRISETDDPFINAIELRTLRDGMYRQAKPGTNLAILSRKNVGGNSIVRYPQDNFDRIWTSDISLNGTNVVMPVNSQEPISSNDSKNLPPTIVMQTAWVMNVDRFEFTLRTTNWAKSLLVLYFAEIERLNVSDLRSFHVTINGERRSETITLVRNYSAVELTFVSNKTDNFEFGLVKAINSTSRPIINAFEYYSLHDTHQPTYSQDIEGLDTIKKKFGIQNWIADPCFLIQWEGIVCDNSSSAIRISEINLSRRNLTGTIPKDIGQLAALVNLSLDNNNLIGPLPDFSSLIMLERLQLQNNNLSGSLPEWLSELKNLKELFIQNNNFSGVIPARLLDKLSLNLEYFGNHYLCMNKVGDCNQETRNNSTKKKVSVVIGITISGCVIIALALVVVITVCWKKFRAKEPLSEDQELDEFRAKQILNEDDSMAFTLKEMIKATQNFSQKIGEGLSATVFYGKLPDGKEIVVKVAKRVVEPSWTVLNEIDLASRVHHKNVASLLGYCAEPKKHMLIYDYMPERSLWDHLHGERAGLNWKTRLKIAIDAAEGLQYLHVCCTPMIIHRNVKSTNIILDSNLNGKLCDLEFSMMTMDRKVPIQTEILVGTYGYMDPEYGSSGTFSQKSDIYSFGVVLLEIICGRKPIGEEQRLTRWVKGYVGINEDHAKIVEIIDKKMDGDYEMKSITIVAKLAVRCVEDEPSRRPTVSEVVGRLKEAMMYEKVNTTSGVPIQDGR